MQENSEMRYLLSFLKIIPFLIYCIFFRLIHSISFSTFHYISSTFGSITNHPEEGNVHILYLLYMKILLNCSGDIEINPVPKISFLTLFHWRLDGIPPHGFTKISLLQRYITDCNFDVICLSETFLNSSLDRDDDRLKIEGYNLIRSDDPSGLKTGGICKEHILLIRRDDLCSLSNCGVTQIRLENGKYFLTCL